ncbi:MAG: mechanosensitive ion channel family protein [Pyrinomonadaceae bacterium]|nr:mechanosensitive ion channel family protein [Pyrinomonadaceae bacterium]
MFQENSNSVAKAAEEATEITGVAYRSIERLAESIVEQLPTILAGIIVLIVFWLIGKIVKSVFLAASNKTKLDSRLRILFSRLFVVFFFVLGLFTALTVMIPKFGFGDLIAGLGFSSFIIGFATKDILNNFLSGILVLWQEPFKIGDYIFMKDNQGVVEHIGVRATRLRMDDGERILIPNGEMYSKPLIIRDAGKKRRMSLKISVSYKSKVKRVKELIHGVLHNSEGVEFDPKPNVYVTDLSSEGINLSVYFWIMTEKNSPIVVFDDIATNIKESLNESDVTLYPPTVAVLKDGGGPDEPDLL